MTILIDDKHTRAIATSHAQYFYFYMALSCVAVAFLGFAPTYCAADGSGQIAADAGGAFSRPAVLRLDAVFRIPELARAHPDRSRGTGPWA